MTGKRVALEHVLASKVEAVASLEYMQAAEAKKLARFWAGKDAYNFRKDECIAAVKQAMKDPHRLREVVQSLPEDQKKILSIVKRYGGALPGAVLVAEVVARGIVKKPDPSVPYYRLPRDPVEQLRDGMLLIGHRYSGYIYNERPKYGDLALCPGILDLLEAASPLAWDKPSSRKAPTPDVSYGRPPAQLVLDLSRFAEALTEISPWKTISDGSLSQSSLNRLEKLAPLSVADPLAPPDCASLYYELLSGLGAIEIQDSAGRIDSRRVERLLQQLPEAQGRGWARAWLGMDIWQDGIGQVPDRDNEQDPVRIEPRALRMARQTLAWALCRVAHGSGREWLDLETFLVDLWKAAGEQGIDFYWHDYRWKPPLPLAAEKDKAPMGPKRTLAFWLDDEGAWAANAILSTLAHLGLVERGVVGRGKDARYFFRLTGLGLSVFGAPETQAQDRATDAKFFTVLPNHDIVVYLEAAGADKVWELARMARLTSPDGGLVQTFKLSRESVYLALESGASFEKIRDFLSDHSRNGLPENVKHCLSEWAGKRETIVIRSGVSIGAKAAGEPFVLMPDGGGKHADGPRAWRIDEDGLIRVEKTADSVSVARLGRFADRVGDHWKIDASSVRRARERGISAGQILGWMKAHLSRELPPLIETAIRNWTGRVGKVFTGELLMLQVADLQAREALLASRRFRPFLAGHIPPDWFVLQAQKHRELKLLLAELGFSAEGSYFIPDLP